MKKNYTALFALLCLFFMGIQAQELKIMSFNMQQPYNTNWDSRVANVASIINTNQPDILGSQELHSYMKDQVLSRVSGYATYGISRECDGTGESSYIFYKTSKFDVDYANSGNFWFKDDYNTCGRGYDPNYNRIGTFMRLKDKTTGKYFYIYNSHFPTPDQYNARVSAAKLLCQVASSRAIKDPVVFTGDFNSVEGESPIEYIKNGSSLKMRDTYREVYPTGTVTTGFGVRYDFIFIENTSTNSTVSSSVVNTPSASDHKPIVATVRLGGTVDIVTQNIPGKIEAESYFSSAGVQTEACNEGGNDVGYIDTGDWMTYRVNATVSGIYKVELRVASTSNTGVISIEKAGGSPKYGSIAVPNTNGWQSWQTISLNITLSAGVQDIGIAATAGGFNINYIEFKSATQSFYQKIEAENYASSLGVTPETCSEGGKDVGWIDNADWMSYDVNLPYSGIYTLKYRVASPNTTGVLILSKNSTDVNVVSIPNTSGWQNWLTISQNVTLSAGSQSLALYARTGGFNLNWWSLEYGANGTKSGRVDEIPVQSQDNILLYPNPFSDNFNFNNSDNSKSLEIYDLNGKLVLKQILTNGENNINTSGLGKGMYITKIQDETSIKHIKVLKK